VVLWLAKESTQRSLGALARELCRAGSIAGTEWTKLVQEVTVWRPIAPTQHGATSQRARHPGAPLQRSPQPPRPLGQGYVPGGPLADWRGMAFSFLQGAWT
jgi:hypothetical protein